MAWFKGIVESSPSCWTSNLWGAQGKFPIIPSTISKGGGRKEASEQNNGSRRVFSFLKPSKCWLCKTRKNPKCPRNGLSTYTSPEWSHYSLRGLYWQQSSLSTIVPWLWAKCLFKHFWNQFHGLEGVMDIKAVQTGLQMQLGILRGRTPTLASFH